MSSFPWLSVIGGVPLVGSIVVAVVARWWSSYAKPLAVAVSLVTMALAIAMTTRFDTGGGAPRFQFTQVASWIPHFGAHYSVGVDGIALVLVDLTVVLLPVVLLASWGEHELGGRSAGTYMALLLSMEAMLIGTFAATDLFLFYVFFEAMLVPMYFVIGSYGRSAGTQRSYAAVKFLLYSLFGGLLMLAAVIGLWVAAGHDFTFANLVANAPQLAPWVQRSLFLGFFVAFAIKAPLWPFHTWLPDAAAEAPTSGAVLLVGVLDKVGTFGFLRWTLPLFPDGTHYFAPLVLILSVIGIFYGALLAVGQRDLKRLVSYTSIAHFGFIALGIFVFTAQGGSGATLYMVNHGFSTGALFLIVGFLIARRRTSRIEDYRGVSSVAPWLAGMFLLAGLSSLALPGTNSFVSEFLVLVGSYTRYKAYSIVATVGIVLAALYILLMIQRTMHGPLNEENRSLRDLSRLEFLVIAPVMVVIVGLGFYPKPVLDVINPAVASTLCENQRADPLPTAAGANVTVERGQPFHDCTGVATAAPGTAAASSATSAGGSK